MAAPAAPDFNAKFAQQLADRGVIPRPSPVQPPAPTEVLLPGGVIQGSATAPAAPLDPLPAAPAAPLPGPVVTPGGPPSPPPPSIETVATSGGRYSPAHEAATMGPKQMGYGLAANDALAHGVQNASGVVSQQVAQDVDMYARHIEEAQQREAGYQGVLAKRQQELTELRSKYEEGAGLLSQAALDQDRFWANESTPKKIAWSMGLVLGGIAGGLSGSGTNKVLDVFNQKAGEDLNAQKFMYKAGSDAVGARQTLYGMAMQQFGNEDAADAMVRAAANDRGMAEIRRTESQWKGTAQESAALNAMAELEASSLRLRAQGLQFVQAQASAPTYSMRIGNQVLHGLTGAQVNANTLEYGVKNEQAQGMKRLEAGLKQDTGGNDEAKHLSDQILKAEIPQGRAMAAAVLRSHSETPIDGIEDVAGLRALPARWLGKGVDAREQSWADFVAIAGKNKFGAVTAADEKKAADIFERGFKNQASRINAVKLYQQNLDQQERVIMGGASPAGQASYRRNAEAAGVMPGASVGRKVEAFGGR